MIMSQSGPAGDCTVCFFLTVISHTEVLKLKAWMRPIDFYSFARPPADQSCCAGLTHAYPSSTELHHVAADSVERFDRHSSISNICLNSKLYHKKERCKQVLLEFITSVKRSLVCAPRFCVPISADLWWMPATIAVIWKELNLRDPNQHGSVGSEVWSSKQ